MCAADPYFDTKRDRLVAFAAQNKLPAIYQFREFAVAGGLISYGPSITDPTGTRAPTSDKSSKARSRPIYRSFNRPNSNS